jgi:Protein of unknown function (DUF1524)
MSKEEFQSNLFGSVYGSRALNHVFINYCETTRNKEYTIEELKKIVSKTPNIEHVLAQTPQFAPKALGFRTTKDFIDYQDNIGNLTILEKSLNSSVQNKNPIDKISSYKKVFLR